MGKPRLLDLFCCEGGAAMGYHRAGFEVVGVDIVPQPLYPFEFHEGDALEVLDYQIRSNNMGRYDAVHASPPCQRYSTISRNDREYPDLYEPIRERLIALGLPWIIENVIGAPYRSGFVLCGSMFGLKIRRHRNFETSFLVMRPQCDHKAQGRPYTITGNGGGCESKHSLKPNRKDLWRYLDMPWATPYGVTQAIPPCYAEWIGERLMAVLPESDP
jgi:DNA (cytosine-5)-methyltransferase 1